MPEMAWGFKSPSSHHNNSLSLFAFGADCHPRFRFGFRSSGIQRGLAHPPVETALDKKAVLV